MTSITNTVPSPPSLPDLCPTYVNRIINISSENNTESESSEKAGCLWATDYHELRDVCIKYGLYLNHRPFKFCYTHFSSLLQSGPTCGLVALSMLLHQKMSPDSLLNLAKTNNFTNNGEMFSVSNMFHLLNYAKENLNLENYSAVLTHGSLMNFDVINFFMGGGLALVPYDADGNHAPCMRQGHKAHWALIVGIIMQAPFEGAKELLNGSNKVHVIAKHGKSKYPAIWDLDDLSDSNGNLVEFSFLRLADSLHYVLPEGGIGGNLGLKNQFILITHQ